MVSVVPKGNCREVEHAVVGSRAGEGFHWLRAFGIADGDGYAADEIEAKRKRGVYALPFYSVEAIYFHPRIISCIAARHAAVTGDDAAVMSQRAMAAGVAAVADHTERLSLKAAKKALRNHIGAQMPSDEDLLAGQEVNVVNNAAAIRATRKEEIDAAVRAENWEAILTRCPVRESPALGSISAELGFRVIRDYEKAVRHLLSTDEDALSFVRGLFGDLIDQING